jgi:hypothetical protein
MLNFSINLDPASDSFIEVFGSATRFPARRCAAASGSAIVSLKAN